LPFEMELFAINCFDPLVVFPSVGQFFKTCLIPACPDFAHHV